MAGFIPTPSFGCQVDRRPFAPEPPVRVGTVVEQPSDRFLMEFASRGVKWRPSIRARGMNQRRVRLQDFERPAALPICDQKELVRSGGRLSGMRLTPPLFLLANDRDDIVVPALFGHRQRGCGFAMWIDPCACVGAMPHQ